MTYIIGTAGWGIARSDADNFPERGSTLQRYASRFKGVEINSSFHRSHRRSTWERWAENVPSDFRFSVKLPKTITHSRKLQECEDLLADFVQEAGGLAEKLAVVLVQLPPKLAFEADIAETFFAQLSARTDACIACEPRNPSWFEEKADECLAKLRVARVAADPACVGTAAIPGGWPELVYFRLHGSPQMYRSSYDGARLQDYAERLALAHATAGAVWCMFDNTASSAATGNALSLVEKIDALG